MSEQLTFEQLWALRMEAKEARQLAGSVADRVTVIDLECYASELEEEAAKLELEQELPSLNGRASRDQFADLRAVFCMGHA